MCSEKRKNKGRNSKKQGARVSPRNCILVPMQFWSVNHYLKAFLLPQMILHCGCGLLAGHHWQDTSRQLCVNGTGFQPSLRPHMQEPLCFLLKLPSLECQRLEETHDSVIAFLSPSAYMSRVTDFYLCEEFEIKLERRGYHFVFQGLPLPYSIQIDIDDIDIDISRNKEMKNFQV